MIRTLRTILAGLALVAGAAACSSSGQNPLAPDTRQAPDKSVLWPDAASISTQTSPKQSGGGGGGGDVETSGFVVGWP